MDDSTLHLIESVVFDILPKVVAVASAIAAITATPKDDTIVGKVYKYLVEWPAFIFGKAKQPNR